MKESVGKCMGKEQQPPTYGGQALVEGVMFGGKNHTVTAIRGKMIQSITSIFQKKRIDGR